MTVYLYTNIVVNNEALLRIPPSIFSAPIAMQQCRYE